MKLILVVEDDYSIRQSLLELLETEGYQVHGAENGQEALNYLESATRLPNLILLDLMMPVMDGWQFRAEQMKEERFRKIPVVVITAKGSAPEKARSVGANGWVKKPIDLNTLLKEVQRFK